MTRPKGYKRIYSEIPGLDRRQEVLDWIERNGYTREEAWKIATKYYNTSWKTWNKILDGEIDPALSFWSFVGTAIKTKLVKETYISKDTAIKPVRRGPYSMAGEPKRKRKPKEDKDDSKPKAKPGPKPRDDMEWITEVLLENGNCAINRKIMEKHPDILKELAEDGIYAQIRWNESNPPEPGLWVLSDADLALMLHDEKEDLYLVD